MVVIVQFSRTSFDGYELDRDTTGGDARVAWGGPTSWERSRYFGTGGIDGSRTGGRGERGAITLGVTFIPEERGDRWDRWHCGGNQGGVDRKGKQADRQRMD